MSYLKDELADFFAETAEILFVPYARPSGVSHDDYTEVARTFFAQLGKKVVGLHTFDGGNTFVLVNALYQLDIMDTMREVVLKGTPYMGTSAGSNIAGQTMQTTNDMPIVYPPSFRTLGLIPFNINPHYLDPDPHSKHKGETRETRIKEFHVFNDTPVIGLREGSWLRGVGEELTLKGELTARLFRKNKEAEEISKLGN